MDIKNFLEKYMGEIRYVETNGKYEVAFPFKLYNDDHISSFTIEEDSTGIFLVSDNGNVKKYYSNHGIPVEEYQSQIKQVCKMFGLFIENGCVKKILGEYETNQTFVQLTTFMNGIAHLATIKYLH